MVLGLDRARMDTVVVKCLADLHGDRHEIMVPRGEDMYGGNYF